MGTRKSKGCAGGEVDAVLDGELWNMSEAGLRGNPLDRIVPATFKFLLWEMRGESHLHSTGPERGDIWTGSSR